MKPETATSICPSLEIVQKALHGGRLTVNPLDDGSGVVMDVDGEQLMTMNASALAIVILINEGAESMEQVVRGLTASFDVDAARAGLDVEHFLNRMARSL